MPVEDIDFLYQNSIKENLIILVDSAKRNKFLYPSPSEFQIDFTEPFNLVYGIEVLDTTIPRTTFMIEDYNNGFDFKYSMNILQDNLDYNHISLISQDFSSAESFFQRINQQLTVLLFDLQIDNYENRYDNILYEQRTKSDYPIIRFTNSEPFVMDMKSSSCFNILGFDQYPVINDIYKYLINSTILNIFTNVNCFNSPVTITPHELSNELPFISNNPITNILDSFISFNEIVYSYTHNPKFKSGSFIQNLTIRTNKTFFIDNSEFIFISIKNITSNTILIEDYANTLFNGIVNNTLVIDFENFTNNKPKSFLSLIPNNTYIFTFKNVYVEKMIDETTSIETPLILGIQIGFMYYINYHNLSDSDKLFYSHPIYSTNDMITFPIIHNQIDTNKFTLQFTDSNGLDNMLDSLNKGSITKIKIFVETNLNLSEDDMFVLSMYKRDGILSQFICEFILKYTVDDNGSFLLFENLNLQQSIFNYINLDINNDIESDIYYENMNYEFTLYHSDDMIKNNNTIIIKQNIQHIIDYQFFKEFSMISPGMINLASENYIILRCEDIENHLRGSYDIKDFSPGLGVLNIDVQGYASGRTEFFSVKYKEFHPIGKLSKMKFRFERKSDGELYNFKNVDLHFLLSIKFFKPTQKEVFKESVLNPNYNPNYLGYLNKSLQDIYDDESSDDDSDIDEVYFNSEFNDRENKIIKKINRNQLN